MILLIAFLLIAGVILWLADPYLDPTIKRVIIALIVIIAVLGLLQLLGGIGPIGGWRLR